MTHLSQTLFQILHASVSFREVSGHMEILKLFYSVAAVRYLQVTSDVVRMLEHKYSVRLGEDCAGLKTQSGPQKSRPPTTLGASVSCTPLTRMSL